MQSADEAFAEVIAGVALAAARRTGQIRIIRSRSFGFEVTAPGGPNRCGQTVFVLPGDDEMSIAKRILGMRAAGLHVPRPVLDLVTPHGDAWEPPLLPPRRTKAELAAAIVPPKPAEAEPAPREFHRAGPVETRPAGVQGSLFGD